MRKYLLLLSIYFITLISNGQIIFHREINGLIIDFDKTFNSGFIITGKFFGADSLSIFLINLDSTGNVIWSRQYDDLGNDAGYSVRQTLDSGFVVTGYTSSYGLQEDYFLMKVNSFGDFEWLKTYGGTENERASNMKVTMDGGFVITGNSQSTMTIYYY